MNQRVKRTQRDYTLAFKQSVVDQVERGETFRFRIGPFERPACLYVV